MDDETGLEVTEQPSAEASTAPTEVELAIGAAIGPCVIEGVLGRGGMGVVYRGRHRGLDAPVAVKVLPLALAQENPELAARFVREARLAACLRHPNVVSVLDVGRDEASGLHYMVQDLVSGGSLRDRLNRGRLSEPEARDVALAIGRALEEAERAGIVHRDIKPGNILLTRDGRAQLADLGLAKRQGDFEEELTGSKVVMGTPVYMSPEQIRETRSVDIRSDLYSLGATLFHLVTGEPPFRSGRLVNLIHKIVSEPAPDPRSLCPELSEPFAAVISRLLQKEPEARYDSAAAFVEALEVPGREAGQFVGGPVESLICEAQKSTRAEAPTVPLPELEVAESRPELLERPARSLRLSHLLLILLALVVLGFGGVWLTRFRVEEQRRAGGEERATLAAAPPKPAPPLPLGPESELALLRREYPELAGLAQGALVALSFDGAAARFSNDEQGRKKLWLATNHANGTSCLVSGCRVGEPLAGDRSVRFEESGGALELSGLEGERSVAFWFRVSAHPWPQVIYDSGPRSGGPGGPVPQSGLMIGLCANDSGDPKTLPSTWRGLDFRAPRLWVDFWGRSFFTAPLEEVKGRWHHVAMVISDEATLTLWHNGQRARLCELRLDRREGEGRFGDFQDQVDVSWRGEGERGARFGRVCEVLKGFRGRERQGGFWDFAGLLDETAAWDRALRPEEIRGMVKLVEDGLLLEGSYCRAIELLKRSEAR